MTEITKPPYGTPCNNCGLCCRMEICPLGEIVLPGATAPCPALESDGDRQVCGLIANPSRYAPLRTAVYGAEEMRTSAALGVGSGVGCDAQLGEERDIQPPESYRLAIQTMRRFGGGVRRKIMKLWANPR